LKAVFNLLCSEEKSVCRRGCVLGQGGNCFAEANSCKSALQRCLIGGQIINWVSDDSWQVELTRCNGKIICLARILQVDV